MERKFHAPICANNESMIEFPIVCDLGTLTAGERERQRELWSSVLSAAEERRELEEGYGFRLPAAKLQEAAELMAIERRCCEFLKLRLEADAAEPHVWFSLEGPDGTKKVLAEALESMTRSP